MFSFWVKKKIGAPFKKGFLQQSPPLPLASHPAYIYVYVRKIHMILC